MTGAVAGVTARPGGVLESPSSGWHRRRGASRSGGLRPRGGRRWLIPADDNRIATFQFRPKQPEFPSKAQYDDNFIITKAEVRRSFITTTVREQRTRALPVRFVLATNQFYAIANIRTSEPAGPQAGPADPTTPCPRRARRPSLQMLAAQSRAHSGASRRQWRLGSLQYRLSRILF